jgi:apolipoprotein D and lipocalin family protein
MRYLYLLFAAVLVGGCTGIPKDLSPVSDFELQRYLGTWYEIARLDHSFERGMSRVTAEYSLRADGGVKVVNRGYLDDQQQWREAVGKAYFVDRPDIGRLKVSFFGPFYGAYNVLQLDKQDYQYALVAGPSRSYLWILARTPHLPRDTLADLIDFAADRGFPTADLIYVDHPR